MVRMHLVPKEEAQMLRKSKTPGIRRQHMDQFSEYARLLLSNPDQAVVYQELGDAPQQFVLSLRGAFRRAGVQVRVRKMRDRDEVRAWMVDPDEEEEQEAAPEPAPTQTEPEGNGKTPRRRRTRTASA